MRSKLYKLFGFTAIGFELAIVLLIFLFAGSYLDEKLNMSPNFIIIAIVGGIVASFLLLRYHIKAITAKDKGDDKEDTDI